MSQSALCRIRAMTVALGFVLVMLTSSIGAQNVTQLRMVITQGDGQTTATGQAFPQRFAVRLTDNQGLPFVGTPVEFENNGCLSFSSGPSTCPFTGAAGSFDPGGLAAVVLTDSSGLAVAPTYVAGASPGQPASWRSPSHCWRLISSITQPRYTISLFLV